jgi:hypothetical protein
VIATNVSASILLHPDLAFDKVDSPQGLSRLVKGISFFLSLHYKGKKRGWGDNYLFLWQKLEMQQARRTSHSNTTFALVEDRDGQSHPMPNSLSKLKSNSPKSMALKFFVLYLLTSWYAQKFKKIKKYTFTDKKISTRKPTTTYRAEAEKTCNASLIGMSAIQHAAAMATKVFFLLLFTR